MKRSLPTVAISGSPSLSRPPLKVNHARGRNRTSVAAPGVLYRMRESRLHLAYSACPPPPKSLHPICPAGMPFAQSGHSCYGDSRGGADQMRRLDNISLCLPLVGAVIINTIQDQFPCTTFVDRAAGQKLRPPPPAGHPSSPLPPHPLASPRRSAASTSRSSSDTGKEYTTRAFVIPKPLLSLLDVRLPSLLVYIAHTWRRTNAEFSNSYMSPYQSGTTLVRFCMSRSPIFLVMHCMCDLSAKLPAYHPCLQIY